ncbi:arsenate reductase ArsC [Acidiphilium sp.]|uniref:arsenate reductase ArsC n=1 Tax=Acidiphilium sp. TaxID=527 RepID=UPI003D061B04
MTIQPLNVLFLCTGNSGRSILAEKLVERWGMGKFRGFSAGSHPKGEVLTGAVAMLEEAGLPIEGLRSKSWDEFGQPGAPVMDFVFTVCDEAAGEPCPVWPGHPTTAHWGVPDPALVTGSDLERMAAFRTAFRMLDTRIKLFASLPFAKLEQASLQRRVQEIGRIGLSANEGSAA